MESDPFIMKTYLITRSSWILFQAILFLYAYRKPPTAHKFLVMVSKRIPTIHEQFSDLIHFADDLIHKLHMYFWIFGRSGSGYIHRAYMSYMYVPLQTDCEGFQVDWICKKIHLSSFPVCLYAITHFDCEDDKIFLFNGWKKIAIYVIPHTLTHTHMIHIRAHIEKAQQNAYTDSVTTSYSYAWSPFFIWKIELWIKPSI